MMVFGTKPKKGSSIKVSDKRRLSLLNSDFKVITGIENNMFKTTLCLHVSLQQVLIAEYTMALTVQEML